MILSKVLLVQQLRLYAQEHGNQSFEGRYAELLIEMIVNEIENPKKNNNNNKNNNKENKE